MNKIFPTLNSLHRRTRGIFVLGSLSVIFFTALALPFSAQALSASETRQWAAGDCSGWDGGSRAEKIDLTASASAQQFSEKNSAVFSFRPGRFNELGSATQQSTLTCESFNGKKLGRDETLTGVEVVASVSALADVESADAIVPEFSLDDGNSWQGLPALVVRGVLSNKDAEGYWRTRLPNGIVVADLPHLQVRFRYVDDQNFTSSTAFIDGVRIDLGYTSDQSQGVLGRFFSITESPVVIIDSRSLKDLEVLDVAGRIVDAPIVVEAVDEGSKISFKSGYQFAPGQYTVRATSKRFLNDITKEVKFSFGLVNINTPKSQYEIGDVMPFAMGVLNAAGKTICAADITLTVKKPHGEIVTLRTSDGSIARSATCGPTSITSEPDYRAHVIADQLGEYTATMTVNNGTDIERTKLTVIVPDHFESIIERVGPTRINPKALYVQRLRVTPIVPYEGTVQDVVPNGFFVSAFTPDAQVKADGDHQTILWNVKWEAGKTYELSYTFDAPDQSPVLYRLGPAEFGNVKEPREWTLASDETVRREKIGVEYESLGLTQEDWNRGRDVLASPTKTSFLSTENAHVKVFEQGFSLAAGKRNKEFRGDSDIRVTAVNVHPKNPEAELGAIRVSERFTQGDQQLELLHLVPTRHFRPGLYVVETTLTDGTTTVVEELEFAWGVLVIDTPKSVYHPGEKADLFFGFLNQNGNTICNGIVTATITDPAGQKTVVSTEDGTVTRNPKCVDKGVYNEADYFGAYTTNVVGDYSIDVTASSDQGTRSISDTLHVRDEIPFEITRFGPSRIYPKANYDMTLRVVPQADFQGTFDEFIPNTYSVVSSSPTVDQQQINDDTIRLRWTVDWKAGQEYTLIYNFDPEDVSPALFLFGPAQVGDFQEYRQWQIASDATDNIIVFWDGGAAPTGWSCVSCGSGDFYQKFPRGAATYGGTGGSATNTHSISYVSVAATGSASVFATVAGAQTVATKAHSHGSISSTTMNTGTSLPVYQNLKVIRYDTTGNPATFPNGSIVIFDAAPTGSWTRYTAQDADFIYGENDATGTGGSATHTHSGVGYTVNASSGSATYDTSSPVAGAPDAHTHTVSGATTASGDHTPPYIDVLLYKASADNAPPSDALAMWDDTPADTNWNVLSDAAETYNGKFLRGNSSYGSTGGTATHTHSNLASTTSGGSGSVNARSSNKAGAPTGHTHTATVSFGTANNTPPYIDVIIAKYTAAATITVSGGCFTDETEGTPCSDDGSDQIKVAVNGTLDSGVDATVDGAWTFSVSQPASGAIMVFFRDGEATAGEEATTVVKYDGAGNVDLVKMYESQLVIGTDSGSANTDQTITNADLDTAGNGYENSDDEDVLFGVASGVLTVDESADKTETLYIMNGDTFRPDSASGDTVTTHHLKIDTSAVITADSNALNVAGDWTNGGTFTANSSTVTFNGSAAQAVTTNGQAFSALTINNTGADGATDNVTISGALDIDGAFNMTNGDLVLSTNDPNVTTAGDVTIGSSAFVTKADNGTATWTFDGTGTSTWTDSVATTQDLGLVTIDGTTKTVNMGSSVRATKLTVTDTFGLASSGYTLTLTGSGQAASQPLTVTGTLNEGTSSTVDFIGSATSDIERESYWNLSVRPGGAVTHHAEGGGTLTVLGDLSVGDGSSAGIFNLDTNDPTVDVNGNVTINASGTLVASASGAFTAGGNWDTNGIFTHSGGTITLDAADTNNTIETGSSSFSGLTLAGSDGSGTWTYQTNSGTVAATLNVDTSDIFTIASGIVLTLSGNTGTTLTLAGTINGPGRLTYQNSATTFPTGGTLATTLITRFDTVNGNMVIPARTDYGVIEAYGASANARTVTLGTAGSQTISTSSHLYVIADAADPNHVTLQGATWDPTLNVGGDFDFTGTGGAGEIVIAPDAAANWTVTGNVNFTDGTYTKSAETLIMNGTSKTLTSAGNTLQNLSLSGSITLANATHTVGGNLDFTSGTITAGSSAVVMTGSANLIGNGQALNDLTIDGTDTTVTVTTSDIIIFNILTIGGTADGNNDTLSIGANRTVTVYSGATLDIKNSGTDTISGAGRLTYRTTTVAFPSVGTISSVVRFDSSTDNQGFTVPARTFGGDLEFYENGTFAVTNILSAGTTTISGSLLLIDNNDSPNDLTLEGTTNNPTVNVSGDIDFTGSGSASEIIASGTGTWTVGGNVNFTDGTYTATVGNTLVMNGTSKTLTSAGNTLQNLTLSGSITLANATHTVAGDLDLTSGTITAGSSTVTMTGTKNLIGNGQSLNNLTIDGTNTTVTVTTSDVIVAGTLTIGGAADSNNDTLSIGASRTVTSGTGGTVTFVASGTDTISGSGTLVVQNNNFDTDGTLSTLVRFDATNGDITMPNRTYGGAVEVYNGHASTARVVTMAAGTHTLSSTLTVISNSGGNITLAGATNDPTVNLTGDFTYTKNSTGTVTVTSGSGTWTASGNVTFTNGTWTVESGNTLVMNGSSKTLTSASNPLHNLTLSGTITLADATHTVAGDFSMAGGTITAGTSTVTMTGTSNTLTGGGATLYNLNIDPSSAGTITLSTSDLTVSNLLTVETGDTLSLGASRTLTLSPTSGTVLTLNGTISGAGKLIYKSTTTFPATGTISSVLRLDVSSATIPLSARTYGGAFELYNNSGSTRDATLGTASSQTLTFSGDVTIIVDAAGQTRMNGDTYSPTINISGSILKSGGGGGLAYIRMSTATWTVGGSMDLSGTFGCSCSSGTINLTGSGSYGFSGQTVKNLTVSGTYSVGSAFVLQDGTYDLTGATITDAGWSLTTWGTANTIKGGNNSLGSIAIGNGSAATTTTFTGSNISYATTMNVRANSVASIDSGVTVTLSSTTGSILTLDGTISGSGTLVYKSSTAFPTAGTISSGLRFDATSGNQILSQRTYGGAVELYNNSAASARTITLGTAGSQTLNFSSNLTLNAANSQALTMQGATWDPTLNITGNFSGISGGSAENVTAPDAAATWTVTGNVDLTGITWTASAETITMDGSTNLIGDGQTIKHLTVDGNGNTVTVATSDLTVSGTITVGGAADSNNDTLAISSGRTLTSGTSGTVTLTGSGTDAISGAGTLTVQNSNLGTSGTLSSLVKFDATSGNITMPARTYGGAVTVTDTGVTNRTVTAGSGTLVFSSTLDITHTSSGTTTLDLDANDPTTTVTGALTIGTGDTLLANSANALNINGNYTNNGTFTDGGGTVTIAGAAQQTFSGAMTGTSDFNALVVTNNSGSDPASSPSVIFSSAAAASTFTATTASVKIRFNAGSTYTFTTLTLNGQATGTRVALYPSSAGTQWTITTTSATVSNTEVKDSYATNFIDAGDGTNLDSGNNSGGWIFARLTVSLDTNTIALGTLSSVTINKGAVISTVTSSTANGYVSHVLYSTKLRIDGSNDIDDTSGGNIVAGTEEFGASSSDSGNDITLWNPTSCSTGASTSDATALSSTAASFASSSGNVTNESTTLCLLASIAPTTAAGAYATTLTIVTTGKY